MEVLDQLGCSTQDIINGDSMKEEISKTISAIEDSISILRRFL